MDRMQGAALNAGNGVGSQFDTAIQQLETAPKKARKKIPPDTVARLQADKQSTISASGRANQISGSGGRSAQGGQTHARLTLDRAAMTAFSQSTMRDAQVTGDYAPPSFPSVRVGEGVQGSDGTNLRGELGRTQAEGLQLRAALSQTTADQTRQVGLNQQLSRDLAGVDRETRVVTAQLATVSARRQKAQQAATALSQASQSVISAAQGLDAVGGQLEGISQALSIIPIVGWSLGLAIKAVAMILRAAAQGLGKTGLDLQKRGCAMALEAQLAGQQETQLQGQRAMLGVRRQGTSARLNMGKQRLSRIQRAQSEVRKALDDNQRRQQTLAARVEKKGERGGVQAQGSDSLRETLVERAPDGGDDRGRSLETRLRARIDALRGGRGDALSRRADQRSLALLAEEAQAETEATVRPDTLAQARGLLTQSPERSRGRRRDENVGGAVA